MEAAEDMGRYECNEKLGERWVTGKKPPHPRFVINAKGQIVYGHPKFIKAMAEKIKGGEKEDFEGKEISLGPGLMGGKFDELRPEGAWPKEESAAQQQAERKFAGYPQWMAHSDAYEQFLGSRKYELKQKPRAEAEKTAKAAMAAVTGYLCNHGTYGFNDGHIKEMQKTFGEIVPEVKKEHPEFFRDDFYVRMLDKHTNKQHAEEMARRMAG